LTQKKISTGNNFFASSFLDKKNESHTEANFSWQLFHGQFYVILQNFLSAGNSDVLSYNTYSVCWVQGGDVVSGYQLQHSSRQGVVIWCRGKG